MKMTRRGSFSYPNESAGCANIFRTMSLVSSNVKRKQIGVYIPAWLLRTSPSTKMFWTAFLRSLKQHNLHPVFVNLPQLHLSSERDVLAFLRTTPLQAFVCHDSHLYERNARYTNNVRLLESHIRFFNKENAHRAGYDKCLTKEQLRAQGLPVLPDVLCSSAHEVLEALKIGEWFVIKPPNAGGGAGVFLVRHKEGVVYVHHKGTWYQADITNEQHKRKPRIRFTFRSSFFPTTFWYEHVLVEPYFNDEGVGFKSLRATVVGATVVESVERVNMHSITSNVSQGGKACVVTLTDEQERMAQDACRAIDADYAGVDFLVSEGKTVVGEINIGPFTTYNVYTKKDTGEALARYIAQEMKTAQG